MNQGLPANEMDVDPNFKMRLYGNVMVVRWTGPSSPATARRFMEVLGRMKASLDGAPMIGVGVFATTFAPPDAALRQSIEQHSTAFFSALQSIHFVFEETKSIKEAGLLATVRFRISRLTAWMVTNFPGSRTRTDDDLAQALANARVRPSLPTNVIVASARRDGLVPAPGAVL